MALSWSFNAKFDGVSDSCCHRVNRFSSKPSTRSTLPSTGRFDLSARVVASEMERSKKKSKNNTVTQKIRLIKPEKVTKMSFFDGAAVPGKAISICRSFTG